MESQHHTEPQGCYGGFLGLGIGQLFCGVANLALGIANAVICGFLGPIGYGIWGSVLCFIGGTMGIVAFVSRKRSTVVAHMVISIIVAVSASVQLAMGTSSAVADYQTTKTEHGSWSLYGLWSDQANDYKSDVETYRASSAFNYFDAFGCSDKQRGSFETRFNGPTVTDALLAAFALVQGIMAILSAVFSCRATVCKPGVDHMPWESEYGSQRHLVGKE